MTSTTSSNNKNFGKLFRWAFSRNRTVMIVFSIMLFIGLVIDVYIITRNHNNENLGELCHNMGLYSISIAQIAAILFALISVTQTFSFLHNKRSTDMFGAIPATRTTLYFSHLLGGVVSVVIPFALGTLLVCGITCRSMQSLTLDLAFLLFGLISIAAVYSFSALIAYCCGTDRDMGIVTLVSNAVYIGVIVIGGTIVVLTIPGVNYENIFNSPILTLFCPIGLVYFLDIFYFDSQTTAFWLTAVWSVLFTAASVLLGSIAAKKRKMETAQSEFSVKWLPVVIKVGASVLTGGFAGLITSSLSLNMGSSSIFVFAFWYILAGFASFFILHLIFSKGVKGKFKASIIAYACTTAGVMVLLFALTTGLGIDTYVPMKENISSVNFGFYNGSFVYKDPENIETITEIHKVITDGLKADYNNSYFIGCTTYYSHSGDYNGPIGLDESSVIYNTNFRFHYNKKIGFSTERQYYINQNNVGYYNYERLAELLNKLYSSEEYKKKCKPFIFDDGTQENYSCMEAGMTYYSYTGEPEYDYYDGIDDYSQRSVKLENDEAFIEGLKSALREDILADPNFYNTDMTSPYYGTHSLLGDYFVSLSFTVKGTKDMSYPGKYGINDEYSYFIEWVNIKKNYSKTLAYLKANGYEINEDLLK